MLFQKPNYNHGVQKDISRHTKINLVSSFQLELNFRTDDHISPFLTVSVFAGIVLSCVYTSAEKKYRV